MQLQEEFAQTQQQVLDGDITVREVLPEWRWQDTTFYVYAFRFAREISTELCLDILAVLMEDIVVCSAEYRESLLLHVRNYWLESLSFLADILHHYELPIPNDLLKGV